MQLIYLEMRKMIYNELPEILTPEVIDVLIEMENEYPQSEEWNRIAGRLPFDEYQKIRNCKVAVKQQHELNGLDKLIDMKRFAEGG